MGRNYYLCKGYVTKNWRNPITKIFGDDLKSLEFIDLYTSAYDNLDHLKRNLYELGFLDSMDQDIIIGRNQTDKKTKEKKLTAIFLKDLIFKKDLELLGISGESYKELGSGLWDYIVKRQNNKDFMRYITTEYINKHTESKRETKAPIFESGDISNLAKIINYDKPDEIMKREYELCFTNFFKNEIYKCEMLLMDVNLTGKYTQKEKVFKPVDGSINKKGFHDLLVRVIRYAKIYEYNKNVEMEEFFENRDFERPLNDYASTRNKYDEDGEIIEGEIDPLDIYNEEEVLKDSKALSYKLDQSRLMNRREDGME